MLGHLVRARGQDAGARVGLRLRQLAHEPLHVELVLDEFLREQLEQLRVRRRVFRVMQVERLDEAAAHELPPDAVGEVARELRVVRRREPRREFPERTELRHAGLARLWVGRHGPHFFLRGVGGDFDFRAERHARTGRALHAAEDGDELVFVGDESFLHPCGFVIAARRLHFQVLNREEEAVEIHLLVVLHREVLVALAALEVEPEEEPADVTGQAGVIRVLLADLVEPARDEPARAAQLLVLEIWADDLARELVPRLVGAEGFGEELAPLFVRAVALHELDVERLGELLGELGRGREPFNELRPLVRRLVREEGARLGRRGDGAGEVQVNPAHKLRICGRCGEGFAGGLPDQQGVHLGAEWPGGADGAARQPDGTQAGAGQREAGPGGFAHGYWTNEARGPLKRNLTAATVQSTAAAFFLALPGGGSVGMRRPVALAQRS